MLPAPPSAVLLNIGGKRYATTADTLTQREPCSLLASTLLPAAASGPGELFVDRDGELFRHVLNWLRDGAVPPLPDAECRRLLREAEYFRMHGLIDCLNERVGDEKVEDESPEAELTRMDVVKCIQYEKVRFRGVNLSGLDLSKLDLSEVDFSLGCIVKTVFSYANLHKAKFGYHVISCTECGIDNDEASISSSQEVKASHSLFHYANLRECEFVAANLQGSTLDRANLQSANLQDACLIKCSFIETDLRSAHLQSANLTGANLSGANLEGANLKGAKLTGTNLQGANLQRAYLREVDLRETQLTGAKLGGANLLGAIR
ncbi:hypothetical protein ACP4OV_027817 [Aristida adscensionis]